MSSGSRPAANPTPGEPSNRLRLIPLPCPTEQSFPLDHLYFEVVYGPLLGPASVMLARAMSRHLSAVGGPTSVNPVDLAREVGLRSATREPLGQRSHLRKAMNRLEHCHVVRWLGPADVGVAAGVPPLQPASLLRLPSGAQAAHAIFLAAEPGKDESPNG